MTSLRLSPDNLPHPSRVFHKTWVARIAASAGGVAFGFQTRSVRQPITTSAGNSAGGEQPVVQIQV